jgi:hypothetical protein
MYAFVQTSEIPKQTMVLAVNAHPGSPLSVCEVPQVNFAGTTEKSGNLFVEKPIRRRLPVIRRRPAPAELSAARVLCHQLRNKRARTDKRRIVHLICLNLQAILKHRSQRP